MKRNNSIIRNTEAAYAVLIGTAMLVIYITFMLVGAMEDNTIMTCYMLMRIVMSSLLVCVGEAVIISNE